MADDQPLLLGEAPSRTGDRYWQFPLSGATARTLCTMAGIPAQAEGTRYGRWTWALYDRFECWNLFERYAEAEPWSVPRAREQAAELLPDLADRVVVCCGVRVTRAIYEALLGVPVLVPRFYAWGYQGEPGQPAAVTSIPHPSGRNRVLNDPEERERCGAALRRALEIGEAS